MIALASSKNGIQVCRWPLEPLEVSGEKGVSQAKLVEKRHLDLARHRVASPHTAFSRQPDLGIHPPRGDDMCLASEGPAA